MKKDGSSKSRSKTAQISKNSPPATKIPDSLAIGHEPSRSLAPQDESLFRAFQANLLSLISHELRTPLTGVLNALTALEEGAGEGVLSSVELVKMARQNAQRLHQALTSLLDLASLESGTFHANLREVDLIRLAKHWIEAARAQFRERNLKIVLKETTELAPIAILADHQKLGRAIDLCCQMVALRAEEGAILEVQLSHHRLSFQCALMENWFHAWKQAWSESLVGLETGASTPFSAFSGVLQSEQAFLVRTEEGLGSELLLIHQVMKLHHGRFHCRFSKNRRIELSLDLPMLSSIEALQTVLTSRAYHVTNELGSIALILINIPGNQISQDDPYFSKFRAQIRKNLFRSTDAVYPLPASRRMALVLDDCKPEDVPALFQRLSQALKLDLVYALAQCPSDGVDPAGLVAIAESRLPLNLG